MDCQRDGAEPNLLRNRGRHREDTPPNLHLQAVGFALDPLSRQETGRFCTAGSVLPRDSCAAITCIASVAGRCGQVAGKRAIPRKLCVTASPIGAPASQSPGLEYFPQVGPAGRVPWAPTANGPPRVPPLILSPGEQWPDPAAAPAKLITRSADACMCISPLFSLHRFLFQDAEKTPPGSRPASPPASHPLNLHFPIACLLLQPWATLCPS